MVRASLMCLCVVLLGCEQSVRVGAQRLALTAPEPRSRAPLYLEVWARAHGSARGPLQAGMTLRSGDRIGLSARTSSRAHVLLLHCDRDAQLSMFPAQGALSFEADRRVQLPAAGMDLPIGPAPGQERLYVLASRAPLPEADPQLALALAGQPPHACGPELDALLRGSAGQGARMALRGIDVSDASHGVARAFAEDDGVVVIGFAFEHAP